MGPHHKALFAAYINDLSTLKPPATAWFAGRVKREQQSGEVTYAEAEALARVRGGPPAAYPRVLGTITKYFFACRALNEEMERQGIDDFVYPQVFVHEMLTGKHQDLWEFVGDLDYLPVGLSPEGEWI